MIPNEDIYAPSKNVHAISLDSVLVQWAKLMKIPVEHLEATGLFVEEEYDSYKEWQKYLQSQGEE